MPGAVWRRGWEDMIAEVYRGRVFYYSLVECSLDSGRLFDFNRGSMSLQRQQRRDKMMMTMMMEQGELQSVRIL